MNARLSIGTRIVAGLVATVVIFGLLLCVSGNATIAGMWSNDDDRPHVRTLIAGMWSNDDDRPNARTLIAGMWSNDDDRPNARTLIAGMWSNDEGGDQPG